MVNEQELIDYVTEQRWYGSKSRAVSHSQVLETIELRAVDPQYVLARGRTLTPLLPWCETFKTSTRSGTRMLLSISPVRRAVAEPELRAITTESLF